MKLYIAGPMRGYDQFNFPAFDRAARTLRSEGHEVCSPAERDRELGFDETLNSLNGFNVEEALRHDFEMILKADGIVLLPGWSESTGARAERFVAQMTGRSVFLYDESAYGALPLLRTAPRWEPSLEDAPDPSLRERFVNEIDSDSQHAGSMRSFETGANRDAAEHKYDYEGYLSPVVIREFGRYMHEHQNTPNGVRPSDNWQKGIPLDVYVKSAWRHFHDVWSLHRGYTVEDFDGNNVEMLDALMAVLFNIMGYAHELLTAEPPVTLGDGYRNIIVPLSGTDASPYMSKLSKHDLQRVDL